MPKNRKLALAALAGLSAWAATASSFAPASWVIISLSIWSSIFTFRGWREMDIWERRLCFWGIFSLFSFSHFLVSDPTFTGWGDVYFFCSGYQGGLTYCLPTTRRSSAFRWNLRGWRKAAALWNFFLSSAIGAQRLAVEMGLGGLLQGEEGVSRESLLSVAWRLIPFIFNRWESTFGAECSSILFELPHFATELLVVLPLTQLLAGRLRIVGHPHLRIENRLRHRVNNNNNNNGAPQEVDGADLAQVARVEEPEEAMVPNVLAVAWERDSRQRRLIPRLRANIRVMAAIAFITCVAAFNALVVPLHLESKATTDPRALTISNFETELATLAAVGRRADATQMMMQRIHASSMSLASTPTLSASFGGCMASGNCTGPLHDRLAAILANKTHDRHVWERTESGVQWLVPAHWVVRLVEDSQQELYSNATAATTAGPSMSKPASSLAVNPEGRVVAAASSLLSTRFASSSFSLFGKGGKRTKFWVAETKAVWRDMRSLVERFGTGKTQQPLPSRQQQEPGAVRDTTEEAEEPETGQQGVASSEGSSVRPSADFHIDRMVALLLPEDVFPTKSLDSEAEYAGLRKLQRGFNAALTARHGNNKNVAGLITFAALYRNLAKHADELRRMRDPEHRALVPCVESALTIMRLSCERWFALVGVYVTYLLFRDPPPAARALVRFIAGLSRFFHRAILLSFPGVCWAYGAGFVFSSFASVVFWSAPLLRMVERLRSVASDVEPEEWHPATPAEVERMGGTCPICWGSIAVADASATANGSVPPEHGLQQQQQQQGEQDQEGNRGQGMSRGASNTRTAGVNRPASDQGRSGSNATAEEGAGDAGRSVPAAGLPCGHAYHRHCLQEWLASCHAQSRPPRCPMCQANVPIQVRWRVPLGGAAGTGVHGEEGADLNNNNNNNDNQAEGIGRDAIAHGDDAGAGGAGVHRRQPGIPGIDALVDDLRDEFRHRFEMPMPRFEAGVEEDPVMNDDRHQREQHRPVEVGVGNRVPPRTPGGTGVGVGDGTGNVGQRGDQRGNGGGADSVPRKGAQGTPGAQRAGGSGAGVVDARIHGGGNLDGGEAEALHPGALVPRVEVEGQQRRRGFLRRLTGRR